MLFCLVFTAQTATAQVLRNNSDSLGYAFGILFGKNIQGSIQSGGFEDINTEILLRVVQKILHDEPLSITPEEANMYVNAQYTRLQQMKFEKNLIAGRDFLARKRNESGVVTLPSGLQYKIITAGSGDKPALTDRVTVHYHGTLVDGTVFDSSVDRGQPATFPVNGVIQGWIEALQLMPAGSKWILYIPHDLAYGASQRPSIEPYSTLIFEVELISINN